MERSKSMVLAVLVGLAPACSDEGCPSGFFDLGSACVDLSSDPDNCGSFGNACPEGYYCDEGVCVITCPGGATQCPDGVCRDLTRDQYNCGSCGYACSAGYVCVDGACTPDCPEGYTECSGTCRNLDNDPANCGECGNACPEGEACAVGVCTFECPVPYTDCSGACADLSSDHLHCGACDSPCAPGQVCFAGSCQVSCYDRLTLCSGACRDLMRDPDNCGACGTTCGTDEVCYDGSCTTSCPGGFTDCAGSCLDLDSDRLNCGACDTECAAGEICVSGACEVTCASPLIACAGTCVDTRYDPRNCGACGSPCADREACVDGSCMPHTGAIGHAVLIGHDYFATNADVENIVGNAVFLANTSGTVNVLAYTQYSDNGSSGEAAYTDRGIDNRATALGRTWSRTALTNYTNLSTSLPGNHVLLVYEQELTSESTLRTIGTAWASELASFVAGGGVVIVCDYNGSSGGTWEIMNSSGLMTISSSSSVSSGTSITVSATTDPVAADVSNPYTATNGTLSFTTSETTVVSQTSGGQPVVIHKLF